MNKQQRKKEKLILKKIFQVDKQCSFLKTIENLRSFSKYLLALEIKKI